MLTATEDSVRDTTKISKLDILYNSSVYTYDVSYLSETAFARNFSSISRP